MFQNCHLFCSDGLNVFHTSKRESSLWEPFYIGTHRDPLFEERLSWEGRKDKITQVSGTLNSILSTGPDAINISGLIV